MADAVLHAAARPTALPAGVQVARGGRLRVKQAGQDRPITVFLLATLAVTVLAFTQLEVDWGLLASRAANLGTVFFELAQFDLGRLGPTLEAFGQTIAITVLATVYSLLAALVFSALGSRNIVRNALVNRAVTTFFTFIRTMPTPVMVLMAMTGFGLGPVPGIIGLSMSSMAFLVRAFIEGFENVPAETIASLQVTGASRLQVFLSAVLPSALSHIVAWTSLRFEINFRESAILGMVGAGGIGGIIHSSLNGFAFGAAGFAIFLVFVYAYLVELGFTKVKNTYIR